MTNRAEVTIEERGEPELLYLRWPTRTMPAELCVKDGDVFLVYTPSIAELRRLAADVCTYLADKAVE